MGLRTELRTQATSNGAMWAMNDFRTGQLRRLRLVAVNNGTIQNTGQHYGPFEIWTWPYVEGLPGSQEANEHFVANIGVDTAENKRSEIARSGPSATCRGARRSVWTLRRGPWAWRASGRHR